MTAYLLGEICQEAGLPTACSTSCMAPGQRGRADHRASENRHNLIYRRHGHRPQSGGNVRADVQESVARTWRKKSQHHFCRCRPGRGHAGSVRSSFANQGQVCLCGSRVFVERPAYQNFVERFVERRRNSKSAIRSMRRPTRARSFPRRSSKGQILRRSRAERGRHNRARRRRATSPNERCRDGYFFPPTVITDLPVACRVNREEIFGPVVTITPFDSEEEVIGYANDNEYGLASSVWTQNLNRAHRVAEQIHTGTVWVNCWLVRDLRVPFGGMKQSGVGREGGNEALDFSPSRRTSASPNNPCSWSNVFGGGDQPERSPRD